MDPTLSVKEVSVFLNCGDRAVRFMLRNGVLKGIKDKSGYWRIPMPEVERLLTRRDHSVKAIAEATGYHPETIREWLRRNRLRGVKMGHWVVAEDVFAPLASKPKRRPRKA